MPRAEDSLLDSVSMLCDKRLGCDKARDASSNYYTILKTTLVVLGVACMASPALSSHGSSLHRRPPWTTPDNVEGNGSDAIQAARVGMSLYNVRAQMG